MEITNEQGPDKGTKFSDGDQQRGTWGAVFEMQEGWTMSRTVEGNLRKILQRGNRGDQYGQYTGHDAWAYEPRRGKGGAPATHWTRDSGDLSPWWEDQEKGRDRDGDGGRCCLRVRAVCVGNIFRKRVVVRVVSSIT